MCKILDHSEEKVCQNILYGETSKVRSIVITVNQQSRVWSSKVFDSICDIFNWLCQFVTCYVRNVNAKIA